MLFLSPSHLILPLSLYFSQAPGKAHTHAGLGKWWD